MKKTSSPQQLQEPGVGYSAPVTRLCFRSTVNFSSSIITRLWWFSPKKENIFPKNLTLMEALQWEGASVGTRFFSVAKNSPKLTIPSKSPRSPHHTARLKDASWTGSNLVLKCPTYHFCHRENCRQPAKSFLWNHSGSNTQNSEIRIKNLSLQAENVTNLSISSWKRTGLMGTGIFR